jgi:signal peptidase I
MNQRRVIKAFFVATLVALSIRLFVFEDYRITSDSMAPQLFKGDLVLVFKSAFNLRFPFSNFELVRTGKPKHSDIVAFSVPDEPYRAYIKRVVAVGGDTLELKKGELWVNQKKLSYKLLTDAREKVWSKKVWEEWPSGKSYPVATNEGTLKDYGPIDIPEGHFFVLGDNRNESIDSRLWGPLPHSCLKGKLAWVWFSYSK